MTCCGSARAQWVCDRQVQLSESTQGTQCIESFRPRISDEVFASFVITARTLIDTNAALDPNASGVTGFVSIQPNGAGVKTVTCEGSSGLSGAGEYADEELIITFDEPVDVAGLVLGFDGIEVRENSAKRESLEDDSPVVFVSAFGTPDFEFTIPESQIVAAAVSLGSNRMELTLGALSIFPPGLLVDRIKIRETSGEFWIDLLGTGCARDCNRNGIPDSLDIAKCPFDDPSCDDCNLNGAPDSCDITDGLSEDLDGDNTPDECFEPFVSGGDWSGDIWGLTGPSPYPDDLTGTPNLHVTLDSVSLFLDITAQIRTLRLLDGAVLEVTQLLSSDTARVGGPNSIGDLTVVFPGGILNEGSLFVANDRIINIPSGPLVIGLAGHYQKVPSTLKVGPSFSSASLSSESITLFPTLCGETDQLTLSDLMTVRTTGDFTMDGTGARPCGYSDGQTATAVGGQTPAILRSRPVLATNLNDDSELGSTNPSADPLFVSLDIGGSFRMLESAEVCVGCGRQAGMTLPTMRLGGDFDNRSVYPSIFDWTEGAIELAGQSPQTFEVAGLDLGRTWDGFDTDLDTLFDSSHHTNFSVAILKISQGSNVTFVNEIANTYGTNACGEALYVQNLTLGLGSTLTLDNVRVYYDVLEDLGATVLSQGCGALIPLCLPSASKISSLTTNRYVAFTGTNAGRQSAVRVVLTTLPHPFDGMNGTQLWVGPSQNVSLNAGSVTPTAEFGIITVATLQCQPYYAQWESIGEVHIYDELIVPGAVLEISEITDGCPTADATNFSPAASTSTSRFGDITGVLTQSVWPPPDGRVDFVFDVLGVLDSFTGQVTAPTKTRADLEPVLPDQRILITDVVVAINAFRGLPFANTAVSPPCP